MSHPQKPVLAVLAGEHARALGGFGIRSSDPSEISRWLSGRLAFALHVPVFADAQLRGARVVEMDKKRGVLIEYAVGGEVVSYFVVPSPGAAAPSGGPTLHEDLWNGYRAVSWNEPGLLYVMIGNISGATLRQLAKDCIEQAGRTMAFIRSIESIG